MGISLVFSHTDPCNRYVPLQSGDLRLTSKCSVLVHGHLVSSKHVKFWVNVTKDSGKVQRHVSICKKFFLESNCTMVELPAANVTITTNGRLEYSVPGVILKYDLQQYTPTPRGFSVCKIFPKPPHNHGLPWLLTLFFIAFFMLFMYFFIKTLLEGQEG